MTGIAEHLCRKIVQFANGYVVAVLVNTALAVDGKLLAVYFQSLSGPDDVGPVRFP